VGKGFGIILIGASATGKSTLAAGLESSGLVKVQPTYTTRQLRPSEATAEPCDHRFISANDFDKRQRAGLFITAAWLYGSQYGVPMPDYEKPLPLFVLKPRLVEPVLSYLPRFRTYQIEATEATVRTRMENRGQSSADVAARLHQHALETATGRRLADMIFRNEGCVEITLASLAEQIQLDLAVHTQMLQ